MRQGVISQRTARIREQAKYYLEAGVLLKLKWFPYHRPFEAIIQRCYRRQSRSGVEKWRIVLISTGSGHFGPYRLALRKMPALPVCGWSKISRGQKAAKAPSP